MSVNPPPGEERRAYYPKADMVHRAVARAVDFIIALVLARLIPGGVGGLVAVAYLLLADGFWPGQSPGKRLGGVKVVNRRTRRDALYRESILRNAPFAVVAALWYVPILGWILFPLVGLAVFAFELYMAVTDKVGLRVGDVLSDTQVVDASVPIEERVSVARPTKEGVTGGLPAEPEIS